MKKFVFILMLLLFVFAACSDQKVDTSKVKKEMKARELKVVPEARIMEEALLFGASRVDSAKKSLISQNWKGVSFQEFQNNVGGFEAENEFRFFLFTSEEKPEGKEFEVYDAYLYNRENNLAAEPNIQKLEGGRILLYNAPLMYENELVGMWSLKIDRKLIIQSLEE